ncbi:DNA-directed RNA polymerase subunit, partial [Haematococcus lacustris]
MITYCPTCGNMCLVELTAGSRDLRYFCQACPYIYTIKQKITTHVVLAKKEVDDVLGGDETWKAAARTD